MTIDLRPAKLDIEAIAGNDVTIVVTVTDSAGTAVNVSGYTIQADVYESGTSVATFTDSVGGASSNEITLSLTDTQTTTLGADSSSWLWSLKVTNAGDTREWLAGRFRLYEAGAAGNTTTTAVALTAGSVSVSVSAIGTGAGGGGAVTSVNSQTGAVVLDADDISDTATTKKFTTAAEITKLAGIETGAEVNDTAAEILAKLVTVDGAGSGLDADTLDGLSSAAFQPIDADLTALAAAGNSAVLAATTASFLTADETKLDGIEAGAEVNDTAAEILAKLVTVDGAGSGLDADLLDGQSSAAFATASGLSDHLADTTDAHDASAISFSPAGTIAGTDVQTAVAEVATDAASALSSHEADTTSVHGIADTSALLNTTTGLAATGAYAVNTVAASGAAETLTLAPAHKVTMDQNCTFTFPSPAAGHTFLLLLVGAFTPTFPGSVDWDSGTPPTYATPSLYGFTTLDGGTTWLGSLIGSAYA